jgi:hypothetical protein
MLDLVDRSIALLELAGSWITAQPLPIQVVAGAAGLAVLWVLSIILRVILVALRAAFRGL